MRPWFKVDRTLWCIGVVVLKEDQDDLWTPPTPAGRSPTGEPYPAQEPRVVGRVRYTLVGLVYLPSLVFWIPLKPKRVPLLTPRS
jgi:hypothetical protein